MKATPQAGNASTADGEKPRRPKAPRSAAQAKASRRNGKKSKGPKTGAGKARSAANALRHGILARRIAPLPDSRLEDREYEHLRDELIREFEPRTMTEYNAVDVLAFDYVKLGRSVQMQEPPPYHTHSVGGHERQYVADAEQNLEVADALIAHFSGGPKVNCPAGVLQELSADLTNRADNMTANAAFYEEKLKEGESIYPSNQAVIDLAKQVDALSLVEWKRAVVMRVLSGVTPVAAEHRQRWKLLLAWWRDLLVMDVKSAQEAETTFLKTQRRERGEHAVGTPKMEMLQRYEAQIRRSIAKGIEFLEARRRARR